jgi:maleylpyruvate isomerase
MRELTSLTVPDEIDGTIDQVELGREIAASIASEEALTTFVEQVGDVDPTAPSRLPDWSIGHVMTHIARNGDGMLSVLAGHPQYPHGLAGRNADIESGSTRTWDELVADVVSRSAEVVVAFNGCDDWSGTVSMLPGERRRRQVPLLRQREVEVHRVDLGLGYEFDDMPAGYVRRDLRVMGMLWTARQPMGMTPLPPAALAAEPATRLAWMMGRADIAGLDPAGLF